MTKLKLFISILLITSICFLTACGGGGGSKEKSAAQKLLEQLKMAKELDDHRIKMVQYQETKYQNADEIGNYAKMLELENKLQ